MRGRPRNRRASLDEEAAKAAPPLNKEREGSRPFQEKIDQALRRKEPGIVTGKEGETLDLEAVDARRGKERKAGGKDGRHRFLLRLDEKIAAGQGVEMGPEFPGNVAGRAKEAGPAGKG